MTGLFSHQPAAKLIWFAPFYSTKGYSSEAIAFVNALRTLHPIRTEQYGGDPMNSFRNAMLDDDRHTLDFHDKYPADQAKAVVICHSVPPSWGQEQKMILIDQSGETYKTCPPRDSMYSIGRSMFETDRLPQSWNSFMRKVDEIWVPTQFNYEIFKRHLSPSTQQKRSAGADIPIYVVPQPVDVDFFDPQKTAAMPLEGVTESTFVILSVFNWDPRKNVRMLLQAYWETFDREADDVLLVILTGFEHAKVWYGIKALARQQNYSKRFDELPRIHLLQPDLPQRRLPGLFKAASVFVLASHGEGWGRPVVEAMAMALPVIATNWSGMTEYMTDANAYPLPIEGLVAAPHIWREVREDWRRKDAEHLWALPSLKHLKATLRWVQQHPTEATEKGRQARKDMQDQYSFPVIRGLVSRHLERIHGKIGNAT